ncbi:hypothetical protein BJV78DRAFT_796951 [Lactifluus subvellereus]|nr:hypothetical protein BJV78DRAFT_796951 [Lactifluus subvellereus]
MVDGRGHVDFQLGTEEVRLKVCPPFGFFFCVALTRKYRWRTILFSGVRDVHHRDPIIISLHINAIPFPTSLTSSTIKLTALFSCVRALEAREAKICDAGLSTPDVTPTLLHILTIKWHLALHNEAHSRCTEGTLPQRLRQPEASLPYCVTGTGDQWG